MRPTTSQGHRLTRYFLTLKIMNNKALLDVPIVPTAKNADFLTITKTSQVYQTSQLDLLVIKMLAKDVYLISILLLNEMISQFFQLVAPGITIT